jgi:hypothetical protein
LRKTRCDTVEGKYNDVSFCPFHFVVEEETHEEVEAEAQENEAEIQIGSAPNVIWRLISEGSVLVLLDELVRRIDGEAILWQAKGLNTHPAKIGSLALVSRQF